VWGARTNDGAKVEKLAVGARAAQPHKDLFPMIHVHAEESRIVGIKLFEDSHLRIAPCSKALTRALAVSAAHTHTCTCDISIDRQRSETKTSEKKHLPSIRAFS
jgi:hypothetical protein